MKAVWKGQIIATADKDELIYIEGNWYFPPSSLKIPVDSRKSQAGAVRLRESDTPYTCPWKGVCQYYDVGTGDDWSLDNAWSYPKPRQTAIEIVKNSSGKDFSGYFAFYKEVKVEES